MMKTFTTLFLLATTGCIGVSSEPTDQPRTPPVEAIAGTCADPQGPIRTIMDETEVQEFVVGRWRHCSGPRFLGEDDAGFEFVADGVYHVLLDDGTGELVRRSGFSGQGTWDTYQEESGKVGLYYHPTPNSGNGGYPRYQENPRRMAIALGHQAESSIYVWIGP